MIYHKNLKITLQVELNQEHQEINNPEENKFYLPNDFYINISYINI